MRSLNIYVMCKYICNRVGLVVKGPHVQMWTTIYKISCIHYWRMWIVMYEWYLVIWRGFPLLFKELLCKLSILELWSMLIFYTWCVILLFYDILSIWIITFGIIAQGLGVSLLHLRHRGIFTITFFLQHFRRNGLEDI